MDLGLHSSETLPTVFTPGPVRVPRVAFLWDFHVPGSLCGVDALYLFVWCAVFGVCRDCVACGDVSVHIQTRVSSDETQRCDADDEGYAL